MLETGVIFPSENKRLANAAIRLSVDVGGLVFRSKAAGNWRDRSGNGGQFLFQVRHFGAAGHQPADVLA